MPTSSPKIPLDKRPTISRNTLRLALEALQLVYDAFPDHFVDGPERREYYMRARNEISVAMSYARK